MKKILLPVDFSTNSDRAVSYALHLFRDRDCEFHFLHIHPIPPYSGASTSIARKSRGQEEVMKQSRLELQAKLAALQEKQNNPRHRYVGWVKYDFFVDGIKNAVKELEIDLIIMGTKGATGLKKLTLGSNTGDVITKVQCPLIAVPANTTFSDAPFEIAFATDFRISFDEKILDVLIEVVHLLQAHLNILHVCGGNPSLDAAQRRNKGQLEERLEGLAHSYYTLTAKELEAAVQCFVESREIGMLAMIAKNLNFFQRILFRPRIEKISYHTRVPFLVLHDSVRRQVLMAS